jgi:hypothetical protein
MMRSLLVLALLAAAAPCHAAPALKMVTIDTEEGAATLFVMPLASDRYRLAGRLRPQERA